MMFLFDWFSEQSQRAGSTNGEGLPAGGSTTVPATTNSRRSWVWWLGGSALVALALMLTGCADEEYPEPWPALQQGGSDGRTAYKSGGQGVVFLQGLKNPPVADAAGGDTADQ